MPLYYFHIYQHGISIRDDEGTRCPDLDAAKREASASAADLARQAVARGEPVDGLCVEIHDEQDRVCAGLTIQEVLSNPDHPAFAPSCGIPARGPLH